MTQWKLVPVEPTEEMLARTSWPNCAKTDYAHMLAAAPAPDVQPVGKFAKFTDGIWREVTDGSVGVPLYTHPPAADVQPVAWTERELELIDEMIEVQLNNSERLERIPNRAMADKQKGWNMERVALLQKIKSAPPTSPDVQELVEPVAWLTVDKIDGCRYPTAFKKSKYDTPLYPHPPTADVSELVEALRRLEEVASDCDIGYMDNAVRHARVVLDKWEGK